MVRRDDRRAGTVEDAMQAAAEHSCNRFQYAAAMASSCWLFAFVDPKRDELRALAREWQGISLQDPIMIE